MPGGSLGGDQADLERQVRQALLAERARARSQQALRILHVADGERARRRGRELVSADPILMLAYKVAQRDSGAVDRLAVSDFVVEDLASAPRNLDSSRG